MVDRTNDLVMDFSFIKDLEKALSQPLPGPEAQYRMAHVARQGVVNIPDTSRQAGVLALFYPQQDDWHIVLIERVTNPNDRHSGQVSFPGGRHDSTDLSLSATALREAEEEVGVSANHINLIGELTNLYIPVSNYNVHPFVGFTSYTPTFQPEEKEVHSILEVPFEVFLRTETIRTCHLSINEQITLRNVPYYHINNKTVWGATAMMLSELVEVIRKK